MKDDAAFDTAAVARVRARIEGMADEGTDWLEFLRFHDAMVVKARRAQSLSDLAENDADLIDIETADARARNEATS